MKHAIFYLAITSLTFFSNCAGPKEPTGVWVNKEKFPSKSFDSVFIVVMTADVEARAMLENDLAIAATTRGYKAVKSIDVMPASLSDPKAPSREEITGKIKETGCDAVLVAALLKQEEAVNHNPGTTKGTLTPYYQQTYYGYYSNSHASVHTAGYYSQEKTYYMQTNLYDAASEELMWTVQSTIFNPASLPKFSKSYTSTLVSQLAKQKVLKK